MKLRASHLITSALAALTCASIQAQSVEATHDTYVWFGDPAKGNEDQQSINHGSETSFVTANDGGSAELPKDADRWSIIRFDLSTFTSSFAENQVSLTLEKISGAAADFVVYGVQDLGADEAFDQATYTFASSSYSAAIKGTATDGGLDKTSLLQLGTFSASITGAETVSFTSTAFVDFLNNDTNDIATFIIYQSTQNKNVRAFASSEHATLNGPMLTAIPEPSTYALLAGLGVLGLALRRKLRASRNA